MIKLFMRLFWLCIWSLAAFDYGLYVYRWEVEQIAKPPAILHANTWIVKQHIEKDLLVWDYDFVRWNDGSWLSGGKYITTIYKDGKVYRVPTTHEGVMEVYYDNP